MDNFAIALLTLRAIMWMPAPYPYIVYVDGSKETHTYKNVYEEDFQGFVTKQTFTLTNEPLKARTYPNKYMADEGAREIYEIYKSKGFEVWTNSYSLDPKEYMPSYKSKPIYTLKKTNILKLGA